MSTASEAAVARLLGAACLNPGSGSRQVGFALHSGERVTWANPVEKAWGASLQPAPSLIQRTLS
eukprot:436437-Pyramimonas_sp.AAC.1